MKQFKNCLHCNSIFHKPYAESNRHWINRHKFCSMECKNKSQKGKAPWNKGKKGLQKWTENQRNIMQGRFKGEKSAVWKGGRWRHYGHKIAFENLPNVCNKCQITDKVKLTCHHKDGNIHNNILDNLEILCHKCHYRHHKLGFRASPKTEFQKGSTPHNKKEIDMNKALELRKLGLSYKKIGEIVGLSKPAIMKRLKTTVAVA